MCNANQCNVNQCNTNLRYPSSYAIAWMSDFCLIRCTQRTTLSRPLLCKCNARSYANETQDKATSHGHSMCFAPVAVRAMGGLVFWITLSSRSGAAASQSARIQKSSPAVARECSYENYTPDCSKARHHGIQRKMELTISSGTPRL